MKVPEDVANARARNRLQRAAALPHPERHFQVFTAPPVHLLVVAANLPEVVPRDGKQPAGHRGAVRGADGHVLLGAFALLALLLALRHIVPVKVAVPGEATDLQGGREKRGKEKYRFRLKKNVFDKKIYIKCYRKFIKIK